LWIFEGISLAMKERNDFIKGNLSEKDAPKDPQLLLKKWLENAADQGVTEYNAMVFSSLGSGDRLSSRVVYLRDFVDDGLVFYTNYNSRKGLEVSENNLVALNFFWKELEQQIRIEGRVDLVSDQLSDAYFKKRPRESQLGAWASDQSECISSRGFLENRVKEFERKFEGADIPRPPHWGGYVVIPDYYEFWQGRKSRLHDRIVYEQGTDGWGKMRIAP
jgi:pyridoxamine 5'-phosphate oxidase